jgi:hypothetical protein
MGSGCIDTRFLDLCTSWRFVVSFTLQLLYPHCKSPWYPLDRRLCGLQSRPWTLSRKENSVCYQHSNSDPSVVLPVAICYTDCATAANEGSKRDKGIHGFVRTGVCTCAHTHTHTHTHTQRHLMVFNRADDDDNNNNNNNNNNNKC